MDERNLRGEARTLGTGDTARGAGQHSVQIHNREHVTIEGVIAVESFDDEEIVLETEQGVLTLRGEELHIKQLDLESGRFAVDGYVTACVYSAPKQRSTRGPKARGFLERLLR